MRIDDLYFVHVQIFGTANHLIRWRRCLLRCLQSYRNVRGGSFVVDMACFLNPYAAYAVNSKVSDNCVNAGYHVWWKELTGPTLGGSPARASSFFESSSFPHFQNYISILEVCMVCVGQNICGILWSHSSVLTNTSDIRWTTHGTKKYGWHSFALPINFAWLQMQGFVYQILRLK